MATKKTDWQPDDSFHDVVNGEFKGVRRVNDTLKKVGVTLGNTIVTSRDPEMLKASELLRRDTMPPGFMQWQLPIVLGLNNQPVMFFISLGEPNAVVPQHRHVKDTLLRVVLSGSIIHNKIELIAGDWVFVPKGKAYSYQAGRLGAIVMHMYNGV